MNKVIFIGRPCGDPEVRYTNTSNGSIAIAGFLLAVNRKIKREGEPDADFFNCTVFGKQAEFVEKYIRKGMKIVVVGRLQNDNYTNKDGQKVYSTKVMVEEIEFAESKNAASNNQATQPTQPNNEGFMNIPEALQGELPFA